jgi:hypothetical protein
MGDAVRQPTANPPATSAPKRRARTTPITIRPGAPERHPVADGLTIIGVGDAGKFGLFMSSLR